MTDAQVVVVGSTNYDRTSYVDALPAPGETVIAQEHRESIGGKGANQSLAAARLGAHVLFLTALGDDPESAVLERELRSHGVEVMLMVPPTGLRSGAASITVDRHGENAIVVSPGANYAHEGSATAGALARAGEWASPDAVVVSQAEVPLDTIVDTAAAARGLGLRFVLNLAPFVSLPRQVLASADPLVVNRSEAVALLRSVDDGDETSLDSSGEYLCRRLASHAKSLVVTLGGQGAACLVDGRYEFCPAPPVARVVDTTGAGDAFVGALASALAGGAELPPAVRLATQLSSLTVAESGASSSYRVWTEELVSRVLSSPFGAGASVRPGPGG